MIDGNEKFKRENNVLNTQGKSGHWNYDPYNHGMFNGMELILSMIENREPNYRNPPKEWIKDKLDRASNKPIQQN